MPEATPRFIPRVVLAIYMASRRRYLGALAGGLALGSGCLGFQGGTVAFADGFEDGLGEWSVGAAIGPEVPLEEFEREASVSGQQAAEGEQSLRLFTEGSYDDGVLWVTHALPVEPGQAYDATVTLQGWSDSESFNTRRDLVARLGREPPEREESFPQPGVTSGRFDDAPYGGLRQPLDLTGGWREYGFEWRTPTLETETLYVSAGVAVIWETDLTNYLDEIEVALSPR
jgi:hypothetical protein